MGPGICRFVPFIRWKCFRYDKFGETLDPGGRRSGSGMMGMFDRNFLAQSCFCSPLLVMSFYMYTEYEVCTKIKTPYDRQSSKHVFFSVDQITNDTHMN